MYLDKCTLYNQLIPGKLFNILPELEKSFGFIPGFSPDNLKEIISMVATHIREEKDGSYWASLKMKYLKKAVPQADQYISQLRKHNIIERNKFFIKGKTSYKYRFSSDFQGKYRSLILTNHKLLRRLDKFRTFSKKQNSKKYPEQNAFVRALKIDPKALQHIEQWDNYKKYNYAFSSIVRILNGDIYYTVDDTSGRYHSNLTNLPKDLRQYITVNGNSLVNIDVKNCQPYLSTLLLTDPGKVAMLAKHPRLRMMLENMHVTQTEDVKRYISLVNDGQFYEYLMVEFNKRNKIQRNRDDVKKKVLIILFDSNIHDSTDRKIFNELFPEVHRVFSLIRGQEKGDHFKDFKRFSILLQKIESTIMLDKILHRINEEYPETIVLTIHDSIMTADNITHIERVKSIMMEEFSKFIGFSPKIKEER